MTPGTFNDEIPQGTDYLLEFQIENEDGTPVDITGATFLCQLRSYPESADVVATIPITVQNALSGIASGTLAAATTAAITPAEYYYDVRMTLGGVTSIEFRGLFNVTARVSRT